MVQDALRTRPPAVTPASDATMREVRQLADALLRLGLAPALRNHAGGFEVPGIGLQPSLLAPVGRRQAVRQELARIRAMLFARSAVTVSLSAAHCSSARDLERILRQLQRATSAPCIDRRQLGLLLPGRQLPLPAYLLMSRVWLGDGPRYAILDHNLPRGRQTSADPAAQALFSALYQSRSRRRPLSPVYRACARSRCALLPDENADTVTGAFELLAPASSAWLPVGVDLCRFCDRNGKLHEAALFAALREGLQLADQLFDFIDWRDARQRRDARENRRIGFMLQGIGDLLILQRINPSSMECLRALDRLVAKIHACLWNASRSLARTTGLLPSLDARDPTRNISDVHSRADWRRRWQDALTRAAVRHRNLLVMSPYSLLPRSGACAPAFADLMPLLAYADVLSFAGKPRFAHWSYDDYRAFHSRAVAVMQRRNAASFVATGV